MDADSGYYTCDDSGSSSSSASSRSSARPPSIRSHHSCVSTEIRRNSAALSRVSVSSSHSSKRPSSKSASIHVVKSRSSSSSSNRKSHKSSEPEVGTAQQAVPAGAHPVHSDAHGPVSSEQHVLRHEEHTPSVHIRSSPDFSSSSSSSNRNPSVSSYKSYTNPQPAYQLKAYSKVPASWPISYKQKGRKYHEHRHHVLRSTSIESSESRSVVHVGDYADVASVF